MKRLVIVGIAIAVSVLASAATVRVVSTDEIPSVSNRTGTVQDRLVDVNAAIYAAKRGAPKGTKFLVVGKNGNLLDDQTFNADDPRLHALWRRLFRGYGGGTRRARAARRSGGGGRPDDPSDDGFAET